MYSSTAGKGSCRRASGPRQHVAVAKSGVALSELLHTGYIYRMRPAEKWKRWHEGLGGKMNGSEQYKLELVDLEGAEKSGEILRIERC